MKKPQCVETRSVSLGRSTAKLASFYRHTTYSVKKTLRSSVYDCISEDQTMKLMCSTLRKAAERCHSSLQTGRCLGFIRSLTVYRVY